LQLILRELEPGRKVVLSTHINADGDGAGCEAAAAWWLRRRGLEPVIVNPTPFPDGFRFLLDDTPTWTPADPEGKQSLREADVFLILDTSEPTRLGSVLGGTEGRKVMVLDHHPATPSSIGDPAVRDPAACATGELLYDLIRAAEEQPTRKEAEALYVAIATDTGSFRFANTTERTHLIAARLLGAGVDPEDMFLRLYAQYTPAGIGLLQRALQSLEVAEDVPVAWISLQHADIARAGSRREDLDGIVEYARRIRGVRVALFFRELHDGSTKVSFRSSGDIDVAAVARGFGGGGHTKAAGAWLADSLDASRSRVLAAVREVLS
jgi:phosphoesterase RecJ-like protein